MYARKNILSLRLHLRSTLRILPLGRLGAAARSEGLRAAAAASAPSPSRKNKGVMQTAQREAQAEARRLAEEVAQAAKLMAYDSRVLETQVE